MSNLSSVINLLLVSYVLLSGSGCSSLNRQISLTEDQQLQVRHDFAEMNDRQQKCTDALDADVSLTLKHLLYSGTVAGYLQAKAPSYLRFEGLNPLGLTESILVSNGIDFTFLVVRSQKAYLGRVDAKKVQEYLPATASSSLDYYWLSGRFPLDEVVFEKVGGAQDGDGYWLNFSRGKYVGQESVLVDPDMLYIKQRRLLSASGKIVIDVMYEYQQGGNSGLGETGSADCMLPERLTIQTDAAGTVILNFKQKYQITNMPGDNVFFQRVPSAFERIVVK